MKIIKIFSSVFITFVLFFSVIQRVDAQCTVQLSGGPSVPEGEECFYDKAGQVVGRSEFSCANYATKDYTGYGCYWNRYTCEGTSCAGGGGGGGTKPPPECNGSYIVDCPPGTKRSKKVVSSDCISNRRIDKFCGGAIGTAQKRLGCCNGYYEETCEEVWQPNQNSWKTVCYQGDYICTDDTVRTYTCVPICSATAPTGISVREAEKIFLSSFIFPHSVVKSTQKPI